MTTCWSQYKHKKTPKTYKKVLTFQKFFNINFYIITYLELLIKQSVDDQDSKTPEPVETPRSPRTKKRNKVVRSIYILLCCLCTHFGAAHCYGVFAFYALSKKFFLKTKIFTYIGKKLKLLKRAIVIILQIHLQSTANYKTKEDDN